MFCLTNAENNLPALVDCAEVIVTDNSECLIEEAGHDHVPFFLWVGVKRRSRKFSISEKVCEIQKNPLYFCQALPIDKIRIIQQSGISWHV